MSKLKFRIFKVLVHLNVFPMVDYMYDSIYIVNGLCHKIHKFLIKLSPLTYIMYLNAGTKMYGKVVAIM